jgi:hypothetical protein
MISETMQGRFDPPVLAGQTSLKPTFPDEASILTALAAVLD